MDLHEGLTPERLGIVAQLIRDARSSCVELFDPDNGDTPWDFGCRAYSRSCHRIKAVSVFYDWLEVVEDAGTKFSFAIDGVPLRFYRGEPDEPPERTLRRRYPEVEALQLAFSFMKDFGPEQMLRLAIETDHEGGLERITLVQVDKKGSLYGRYEIPFALGAGLAAASPFGKLPEPQQVPPPAVQLAPALKSKDDAAQP